MKDKSGGQGDVDPVTIADLTVQKTIEITMHHFFPGLKIQGEESQLSMQAVQVQFDPASLD